MSRAEYEEMLALLQDVGERIVRAEQHVARLEREHPLVFGPAKDTAQTKGGAP